MTEMEKACRASWKCGGWGFTPEELLALAMTDVNGQSGGEGDVVANVNGQYLTRSTCNYYWRHWSYYQDGFYAAWKLLQKPA